MPRDARVVHRFIGGNLALDFANTIHRFGLPGAVDEWRSVGDVIDWAGRTGTLTHDQCRTLRRDTIVNTTFGALLLRRACKLRRIVYDMFAGVAASGHPPRLALRQFNDLFSEIAWRTKIVQQDERYTVAPVTGLAASTMLIGAVVRAGADLLTSAALARVRQRRNPSCSWLFVDTSRNGSRRWCSMELCGNLDRVRAFRRRAARRSDW